jgi:membrane-associated protease RseP (regulator of RpoE activity)
MSDSTLEGSAFSRFMASGNGRLARIALGVTLMAVGLVFVGGAAGLGLATFGLVPIAAGVFNLCPVAPIWGGHLIGARYCPARSGKPKD